MARFFSRCVQLKFYIRDSKTESKKNRSDSMENYKVNIINVLTEFLVELGNEVPQCQNFIEENFDGLVDEINSTPEPMDVDTSSTYSPSSPSTSTNTNDNEVRKCIAPLFFLILNLVDLVKIFKSDIVLSEF